MPADSSKSICSSPLQADEYREDRAHILTVRNLSRRYSDRENSSGIEGLSFSVRRNHIAAIIGKSGSGKSTLLRLIYGLLEPEDGEIRFDGYRVQGPSEKLIPGHDDMRMVSQHFDDLNTFANVYDNVASRLSNEDLEGKEARTLEILKSLRIDHLRGQRLSDLSGGEKQRVSIARALVTRPKLLLMDEPFNQVDAAFRDQLQRDLRQIVRESGLTVILVSHDPSEVMGLADQLLILLDGRVVADGQPFHLYQHPPTRYVARMLAKSNILNPEQALSLQISIPGECFAVHPEWIKVSADENGAFQVDTVMFRGFYEELIVRKEGVYLRVYQMEFGQLKSGDRVSCAILNVRPVLDTGR